MQNDIDIRNIKNDIADDINTIEIIQFTQFNI